MNTNLGRFLGSWIGYKNEFSELAYAMTNAELQLQFGDGSEEWVLRNCSDEIRVRFLTLCQHAGQTLLDIHLANHETGSEVSAEVRWFRLLRERNHPQNTAPVLLDREGVALSEWTLTDVASVSASLCFDLHRTNPIQPSSNCIVRMFQSDPFGASIKVFGGLALAIIFIRILGGS